jgi:hypothetical protein
MDRYGAAVRFFLAANVLIFCSYANAQVLNQDQTLEAHNLPSLVAKTKDPLEDSVQAADPGSLKDVATKLNGRHLLSDGRPIMVSADYAAADSINSGLLVSSFVDQQAALMEWNSHIYVVHGIVYFWASNSTPEAPGPPVTVIRKFLLWDTRYSDSRREVVFNRDSDDLSKVQGVLFVRVKLP